MFLRIFPSWNTFVFAVVFSVCVGAGLVGLPSSAWALSTSTPEIFIDTPLQPGDVISLVADVGRMYGEDGALTVGASFEEPCPSCITGVDSLVIPADAYDVSYPFSLSTGGLASGVYTQHIVFRLYSVAETELGSMGMDVSRGMGVLVHFSIAGDGGDVVLPESGGGGGGGGGGVPTESVPVYENPPVVSVPEVPDSVYVPLDRYVSGECSLGVCDANNDGAVNLNDVIPETSVSQDGAIVSEDDTGDVSGQVTKDNIISLYFEHEPVSRLGGFNFVSSARAAEPSTDDIIFNLYLDTGISNVYGIDTALSYDAEYAELVGMNTFGSVFGDSRGEEIPTGSGNIHLAGIARTPFSGQHHFIAAFRFSPLQSGPFELKLQSADVYVLNSPIVSRLELRSTIGSFGMQSHLSKASDARASGILCGCMRTEKMPLCISLLLCGIFAGINVILLLVPKRKKRTV